MLAAFPELVHMDKIAGNPNSLNRLAHLGALATSVSWYAEFPGHYSGDAHFATHEKGAYAWDRMTKQVAQHIANVKNDTTTPALLKEFYARAALPTTEPA